MAGRPRCHRLCESDGWQGDLDVTDCVSLMAGRPRCHRLCESDGWQGDLDVTDCVSLMDGMET